MSGSQCRSCGASIIWLRMASGKAMPIDAEPAPGGNIRVHDNGSGEVVSKDVAARSTGLHLSHHATCPRATEHRLHHKPRQKDLFVDRVDEESQP